VGLPLPRAIVLLIYHLLLIVYFIYLFQTIIQPINWLWWRMQDDKKSKVGKETLDLAAFAKEGQQSNHNLALGKKNPPVLMVPPTPADDGVLTHNDTGALTTHLRCS
jgi:hypothetical protein